MTDRNPDNRDLRQPVGEDEDHLIQIREQAIRCLKRGYGLEEINDAIRQADAIVHGYDNSEEEPLPRSYRGLHIMKNMSVKALEAGYGTEEIGDAVYEASMNSR